MKRTNERLVSDEVLERPKSIIIGGRKYRVAKQTFGVIVELSAGVSELPDTMRTHTENILAATLRYAKDYRAISFILARVMCGEWLSQFGRIGRFVLRVRVRRLAAKLYARHTPEELERASRQLIDLNQVASFFALSVFLSEINLLKATRKTETTASGQQ